MIPHALRGASRAPVCLLDAMRFQPLVGVTGAVLGASLSNALIPRGLATHGAAIPTPGLTAATEVERLAAACARPHEESVVSMFSLGHPRVEPTKSRRRTWLGPQSARDNAVPPAGRPGSEPGRPSRQLSQLSFPSRSVVSKFSAAPPEIALVFRCARAKNREGGQPPSRTQPPSSRISRQPSTTSTLECDRSSGPR